MIPGYLITKKTSWRFDDLGGFRATFLGPKLDFFSCVTKSAPTWSGVYTSVIYSASSFGSK